MKTLLKIVALILATSCGQKNNSDIAKDTTKVIPTDTLKFTKQYTNTDRNTTCSYNNDVSSLGIGLVMAPVKFIIFNDSTLTDQFANIDMYEENTKEDLCSKFFKPDYGIMHFVCLDSSGNNYKVLSSYSSVKFLSKTNGYEFKSWNDYILQSFGIRRELRSELSLMREPAENAESLIIPSGHEMFCPMEIQGDWVKVKYDCFYNNEENPHEGQPCHNFIDQCKNPLMGWIKWRQGNKLLIDIFLMP